MEKYIEIFRTIVGVIRASFYPDNADKTDVKSYAPLTFFAKNKRTKKKEITIVSWNILRNYNKDLIHKYVSKIIQSTNPDIILLQEFPIYKKSSFADSSLFQKYNKAYAPLHKVRKQSEFYNFIQSGQLTLSKSMIDSCSYYKLPKITYFTLGKNHEITRTALYTQLRAQRKKIGIYNIHLENTCLPHGRKMQVKHLLKIINSKRDDIIVIGGDFNTFLGRLFEKAIKVLEKEGFYNAFADEKNRFIPRLDYFFIKGATAKGSVLEGKGSDHNPIMIQMKL